MECGSKFAVAFVAEPSDGRSGGEEDSTAGESDRRRRTEADGVARRGERGARRGATDERRHHQTASAAGRVQLGDRLRQERLQETGGCVSALQLLGINCHCLPGITL